MSETVYNITIPNTSSTLTYSPYVTDNANSGGWQSVCPTYVTNNGINSWICDPDSAHTTSSFKASFQLSFEGVGIYLIGNTTNNLGYDISLDGVHFPGNFRSNAQSLYSSIDLKPGLHTISLTVRQPVSADNPGSVTLKEVVVDAGTGRSGATVAKRVLDDMDPSITYYSPPDGDWTIGNAYPQATHPEGVTSFTFHDSYWANATATVAFKGAGISVYGACYSHSRYAAYSATMDGSEEIQYDGTINLYSIGGDVKQRAGNCLRYFKAGLDADKDHELVLRVKDMGRLAVDWVEIFTVEGGNVFYDEGQGGDSTGIQNNTTVAIIAGAISGGVVLLLALLTIILCLRRKRTEPQEIMTPAPSQMGFSSRGDASFISTPFTPSSPRMQINSHEASGMAPWPQLQTLAPSMAKRYSEGTPARLSYSSGRAPLASPGLTSLSSYTGSTGSGPGWSDSAGYQTTAFNCTTPIVPSISRPSEAIVRMGSLVPNTREVYASRGPMGEEAIITEAGPSTGVRPNHQVYASGVSSSIVSPASLGPPACEQLGVPEGANRVGREKRV
ncbi:unnamed protein product [Rhizoctonia solani]|uniref:Uncharacterized protein n=1 Tax=Rhizoctonia solani TaxID=456999 RepID=A0A8H3GRR6_9AGAM|nr:unnamed protein product [Rhizoctonia solani]